MSEAPKPGQVLEQRVADAYRAMGARKVEHDVELAGNQIDVYVEMESADRGLHKIAVEVKDWRRPVGIDVINQFTLVIENLRSAKLIDEGVIVSASGFSRQARNAAGAYRIRLLDIADLEPRRDGRSIGQTPKGAEVHGIHLTRIPAMTTSPTVGTQAERGQSAVVQIEHNSSKVTVQVFLSYAREDKGEVEKLYQKLSDAGFKPWIDKRDILPGENWKFSIQQAIQRSDFFLVCLSANSVNKRGFLQKEIRDALDIWQQMLDSDIYLIPVRLADCEVPESLRKFQWVDLFEDNGWTRLVKAIHVGMQRRGKVIEPIAQESTIEARSEQGQPKEVLQVEQGGSEQASGDDLEFTNRETELGILIRPIDNPGAPRYVQVYAPSGLGKTYLLKKAQTEYEAAGWFCAWLDFTNMNLCLQIKLVREQLGVQFGADATGVHTCADLAQQVVRARKRSVIFLDAVDLASGEVRRWIKGDLIPNLEERIPDPKFRPYFIAAGRYPIREWAVYSKQKFKYIQLTPFSDTVVDDLLRQFAEMAGYKPPGSFFQQTTEAILFITKGHPACIRRVLHEIQSRSFTILPQEITQASTFNRTVGDLLDKEILVLHVPEKLKEIFKTLCVLRGYTPNLLDRLARDGWVPAREHIDWSLESELLMTRLVEMPDSSPLYRLEPLIRQLVALQMEYNDKDRFLRLNRAALEVFEEQVKGKDKDGNELPNRPYDRMQVALAVEALYHQAALLRQDKAGRERARSELLDKIREYLSSRLTRESDNYWVNLLLGTIERDAELTALIYELTGESGLESVLQPLYFEGPGGLR